MFDVNDWIKYKLGIFSLGEATDEMKAHVAKCLEVSKNFRELLVRSESVKLIFAVFW
jgi:hypothetical protein